MTTISYRFKELPSYQTANKKCCKCGKQIRKTFKSFQTINPWNNKTPGEIYAENAEQNSKKVADWLAVSEECAACIKGAAPDVEIVMIGDAEWNEVIQLREGISEAERFLRNAERHLSETFKGKCIGLKDGRLGMVNELLIYRLPKEVQLSYNIVRKDKKGLTDKTEYERIKVPTVEQ